MSVVNTATGKLPIFPSVDIAPSPYLLCSPTFSLEYAALCCAPNLMCIKAPEVFCSAAGVMSSVTGVMSSVTGVLLGTP